MLVNKKIIATLSLFSIVIFAATASMEPEHEGFKNLKVLPKKISKDELHKVMEDWEHSLGVKCNFCHVRNNDTKKMDWANDAKPEKDMARQMFKMTAKINKKYFKAEKDGLGMIKESSVNCNSCHHGEAHPEVKVPEGKKHDDHGQAPKGQDAPTPTK